MPTFYVTPYGTPVSWRDEQSGELPAAVKHFFDWCLGHAPDATAADLGIKPMTDAEIKLVGDFISYFIHAPCWEAPLADWNEMRATLAELRERSKNLGSVEGIRRWLDEASDVGFDPF